MNDLFKTLAAELERVRELPLQVVQHVGELYEIDRDAVGDFLTGRLPHLEDYEIDLILSPVFTPALEDQAVFADLLGDQAIPAEQWPELVTQLAARPTLSHLRTDDGEIHAVPLREVTIERYVGRLRLGGRIAPELFQLILNLPPAGDRPLLKAVARRAVWEKAARSQILLHFLTVTVANDTYRLDDVVELLNLAETYEPADVAELAARIPHWQQVLRHEINLASNPKPFFNERIQEMHGGGRDRRGREDSRIAMKQVELEFLGRLQAAVTRN